MSTARTSGTGIAEDQRQQREPDGVADRRSRTAGRRARAGSCPGPRTTGSDTRFVSWTLMTTARTIGSHENTPKMTSSGSRNTSVLRPSRITRAARRRGGDGLRVVDRRRRRVMEPMAPNGRIPVGAGEMARAPSLTGGRAVAGAAIPPGGAAAAMRRLGRRPGWPGPGRWPLEQGVDVRVLVGQHGLDDGVEDRVHLLGVR